MGKVFKRLRGKREMRAEPDSLMTRVARLEVMLYESNAYIVRLVNWKEKNGHSVEEADADFLQAAEEFRKELTHGKAS